MQTFCSASYVNLPVHMNAFVILCIKAEFNKKVNLQAVKKTIPHISS